MCDKYIGFTQHLAYTFGTNDMASQLFSDETIQKMSMVITKELTGVLTNGKKIKVPDETIRYALSSIFENYRPNTQDIYTRLNIVPDQKIDDYNYIILQTLDLIINDVKENIETNQKNSKLTIWTTILGDNNPHGLRSHDQIKLRKKRPTPMLFNMNY